jgi:hypothetical protein
MSVVWVLMKYMWEDIWEEAREAEPLPLPLLMPRPLLEPTTAGSNLGGGGMPLSRDAPGWGEDTPPSMSSAA